MLGGHIKPAARVKHGGCAKGVIRHCGEDSLLTLGIEREHIGTDRSNESSVGCQSSKKRSFDFFAPSDFAGCVQC